MRKFGDEKWQRDDRKSVSVPEWWCDDRCLKIFTLCGHSHDLSIFNDTNDCSVFLDVLTRSSYEARRCCHRSFRSACQFIQQLKLITVALALLSSWHNHCWNVSIWFFQELYTRTRARASKPIKTDQEIRHRLAFKPRDLSIWERKL